MTPTRADSSRGFRLHQPGDSGAHHRGIDHHDPGARSFSFYADMVERGLLEWSGFQESLIRMAPLLLTAAGLIVAFRANLWNLGADGQLLLGAAVSAGLAPSPSTSIGVPSTLALMLALAALIGAVWTIVPALLRAHYGVNEVITTLMMSFIGVGLANVLVKGPFETEVGAVSGTDTLPLEDRLPDLFGTRVHSGSQLPSRRPSSCTS